MKKIIVIILAVVLLLTLVVPVSAAGPKNGPPPSHIKWPIELHGTLNNAEYEILVPVNWNGTLLVYAHGYTPVLLPAEALPDVEIGGVDGKTLLLSEGYALAGTANKAAGWAVKEGIQNNLALTNYFKGKVGNPERVILLGFSMGSAIVLESIEKYPGIYDGAITGGSLGAGIPMNFDLSLGFSLAYDVAFGWTESWGLVGDVRDDLNFETDVLPILSIKAANPANFGKIEFIRLVCDFPEDVYDIEGTFGQYSWFFTDMFYATQVRAELEKRAGGPVAQNLDQVYSIEPGDMIMLGSLGVNAPSLLAEMNSRTNIIASIPARKYAEHYATFTGDLKHPVITIQTRLDEVVREANEGIYHDLVEAAGKGDFLVQVFTDSIGHCNFSGLQLLQVLSAMEGWLDTGVKPDPANPILFPTIFGFIPGFMPPPWPFVQ